MITLRRGTVIGYGCGIMIAGLAFAPNAQALFPFLPDKRTSIFAPATPKPNTPPPMINGVPIADLVRDGLPPNADKGFAGGNLWKEGFADRFRRTGDSTMYAELVRVMEMRATGANTNDIVKTLLHERTKRGRTGIGPGYGTEVQKRQVIEGLSGAAGLLTTGILAGASKAGAGGLAAVSLAKVGLAMSEELTKHGKTLRRQQRIVEEYNRAAGAADDPERRLLNAADLLYHNDPSFADVYDHVIRPGIGFGPRDSDRTVLESYPQFRDSKLLQEVVEKLERGEEAHAVFAETQRRANQELAVLREHALRSQARQQLQDEAAWNAARREVKIEAFDQAFQILGYAVGITDPVAAKKVVAVGKATVQIYRAFEAFDKAMSLGKDLWGAAGVALTGNLLGAGLKLFSAFVDTGPTVEEQILKELQSGLKHLSEQIETTRKEMHARFDRVDRQFQVVHTQFRQMHKRFDELSLVMKRGFNLTIRRTTESDERTRQELKRVMGRMLAEARAIDVNRRIGLDTQDLLIREAERLGDIVVSVHLAPCLRARSTDASDSMTDKEFLDCLSKVGTLAQWTSNLGLGSENQSAATQIELMRRHPDRMMDSSLMRARQLLAASQTREGGGGLRRWPDTDKVPEHVVPPAQWFFAADIHGRFLERAPSLKEKYRNQIDGSDFVQTMRTARADLINYSQAMRSAYEDDVAGKTPGVFGRTWLEAKRRVYTYRRLLQEAESEYYQDQERYKYIREGMPELDLTGDPYTRGFDGAWEWRNWKDHWQTTDEEVPGWYTFPPWWQCVARYPELKIYDNAVGNRRNKLVTHRQTQEKPRELWKGRLEKGKKRWNELKGKNWTGGDKHARYREVYLRNRDAIEALFIFPVGGMQARTPHDDLFAAHDLLPAKAGIAKIEICAVTGQDENLYLKSRRPRWWGRIIARYEHGSCAVGTLLDEHVSLTKGQMTRRGIDVGGTKLKEWLEDDPLGTTEEEAAGFVVVEHEFGEGSRMSTLVDKHTATAYGVMKKIGEERKKAGLSAQFISPNRGPEERSECQLEYDRWFAYEREKMRNWLREKLSTSKEVEDLDQLSALDDMYVRAWLDVAFPLGAQYSTVASAFATEAIEFPKYGQWLRNGLDPWKVEDEALRSLDHSFGLLRSEEMQRAARRGGVHLRLEATRYENLGEAGPSAILR